MGSATSMLPTVLPISTGSGLAASSATRPLGFRLIPARSTCATLSILLPPAFEAFAKDDRRRVHDDEECEEHDDRSGRFFDESALGAVGPQEYLQRKRR